MQGFFQYLQQNPYLLLFFVVGLAVWIGRASIKGYGLGMVAGAIVVGAGLSVWASVYGVKLELNSFAKSLFYYLFMYGVGLRVGPSFINSLWLPRLQDQSSSADGRRCRGEVAFRPVPRGGSGDPELRALDRIPGRLRRLGHSAHRLRIFCDDPRAVG